MGMDPPWGQALLGVGSCMGMDPAWGHVLHGDGSCFGSGPAWGRALLGYTHPQTPQLAPAAPKARAMLTCPGHAAMHVHPQRAQPRRRTPQPPRCSTPTTPPTPPPPPPAPLPVLTGRPFTQLAQPVLQPGTARAAQPQCQHRQQHGAQQQSRGEGTAPYESRPSAPHGLHKAPLFVPPHPPPVPSSALTSCWCCCGAAVLAAPRPGAVTGWGGPALLTVAVPVVVAHLGGGDTVMLSLGHW